VAAEVNYRCRHCGKGAWVERLDEPAEVTCTRCSHVQATDGPGALNEHGQLIRCVVCACDHMYKQRDFNRKIGLAIVAVAALFSVKTYGLSLLVAAIIDLGLYLGLPEIVLCYHCQAIHRGFSRDLGIEAYDLATHERLEDRDWGKLHESDVA